MTVRPISIDELDRLGIDDTKNALFWDGKEVVTQMTLPWWVHVSALITAGSSLVAALAALVAVFK